jgi:hypothetical protein
LGDIEAREELETNKFGRYGNDNNKKKEEERRIVSIREGREQEMEKEPHSAIHNCRHCSTVDNCLTH